MKKKFGTMSPAQQRVAIAKDALAWIKAGVLIPSAGVYVEPVDRSMRRAIWYYPDPDKQLRDVFLGKCEVCAIGAMFLAKAVRFDDVAVDQFLNFHAKLADHFEKRQLAQIEAAFEGKISGGYGDRISLEEAAPAFAFYRQHREERSRLVAILTNIIDNNGEFVP